MKSEESINIEPKRENRRALWLLLGLMTISVALVAGLAGFAFYRSEIGPSPSFVIKHSADVDIQQVYVNGVEVSLVGAKTQHIVGRNVRPADEVKLRVIISDGRICAMNFREMGRETRVVEVNASNLTEGDHGVLKITFDSSKRQLKKVRYEPGRWSIVYDSPYQRALIAGIHEIEVEWEEDAGTFIVTRGVEIVTGETVETTLDEFMSRQVVESR
jgi:hypothetical protein